MSSGLIGYIYKMKVHNCSVINSLRPQVGHGRASAHFKSLILEHFFSDAYLRKYFATRTRSVDWKKYMKTRMAAAGSRSRDSSGCPTNTSTAA